MTGIKPQPGVKPPAKSPKAPAGAAAGGGIAMTLAAYFCAKAELDPEMIGIISIGIAAVMSMLVHYMTQKFPYVINALEDATGRDIDGDGDIGK